MELSIGSAIKYNTIAVWKWGTQTTQAIMQEETLLQLLPVWCYKWDAFKKKNQKIPKT